MIFAYVIVFHGKDGFEVLRKGSGEFYPSDMKGVFRLEDMLWKIAEDYNIRPEEIEIFLKFRGAEDGETTPKCTESPKAEAPR